MRAYTIVLLLLSATASLAAPAPKPQSDAQLRAIAQDLVDRTRALNAVVG